MNQTIKKLASQCWDQRLDGRHFDQEMFARLVAAECARIVDNVDSAYGAPSTGGNMIRKMFELDISPVEENKLIKQRCNALLAGLFGKNELVERWWNIPNVYFEQKTPNEMFDIDPKKVYNYIIKFR